MRKEEENTEQTEITEQTEAENFSVCSVISVCSVFSLLSLFLDPLRFSYRYYFMLGSHGPEAHCVFVTLLGAPGSVTVGDAGRCSDEPMPNFSDK